LFAIPLGAVTQVNGRLGLMTDMIEVRIHGRGGQGNVAAAELLALAAFDAGYEVQAFPAFGAERTGSPVQAFVRLSNQPIRLRSQVYEPDVVLVQDLSLSQSPMVVNGLKKGGTLLLNVASAAPSIPNELQARVFTVPATRIAVEILGRPIPNAVMLGALAAATRLIDLAALSRAISQRFTGELAEKNIRAAELGYYQVQRVESQAGGESLVSEPSMRVAQRPLADVVQPGSSTGYLTASWRTSRPVFLHERCNGCDLCAEECPVKDIVMVAEGQA
jgi:pyruvate ferredoxin oxidoreductase gamma subunit